MERFNLTMDGGAGVRGDRNIVEYHRNHLHLFLEVVGRWEMGADGLFQLPSGLEMWWEVEVDTTMSWMLWVEVNPISAISASGRAALMASRRERRVVP